MNSTLCRLPDYAASELFAGPFTKDLYFSWLYDAA